MASVPPSYKDLGKSARDLFSKGFNYGSYNLECKTKTASGVEFTTSGDHSPDSGKVNGSLETKYKWKEYGLTFNEKWNTDNTLGTEITVEDQIVKGLKLSFDTKFAPQTGKKSACVKTTYKREYLNVNSDVNLEYAGPVINAAAVLGYNGWLMGYQMSFDTAKSKLNKSNFASGYVAKDFTVHANVNDGKEFAGSYYQKVNRELETGVQLSHTVGSATRFGLAGKYTPDRDTVLRAKINNSMQIGLSYEQKIRKGVTLTVSSLLEGKSFNEGGHKVGLGIDLEA